MVALQILVLSVWVRILVRQHEKEFAEQADSFFVDSFLRLSIPRLYERNGHREWLSQGTEDAARERLYQALHLHHHQFGRDIGIRKPRLHHHHIDMQTVFLLV